MVINDVPEFSLLLLDNTWLWENAGDTEMCFYGVMPIEFRGWTQSLRFNIEAVAVTGLVAGIDFDFDPVSFAIPPMVINNRTGAQGSYIIPDPVCFPITLYDDDTVNNETRALTFVTTDPNGISLQAPVEVPVFDNEVRVFA